MDLKSERGENMFQVGSKVFVISVPQKYQCCNLLHLSGTIKGICGNGRVAVEVPGKHNEKSSFGYFYLEEENLSNILQTEQEEVKTVGNSTSVVKLWEKRSIEKIDKEAEIKLMELLAEDEYTHDLILHMNDLKDAGFKVEIPNNIYDMTSDYTRGMRTITLSSAEEKKVEIKKVAEEVGVLLEMCKGDVVKEMEILCSYGIVEYPFGRMTVGGSTCGK